MKTILAKYPHESSFSFSRRFNWRKEVVEDEDDDNDEEEILRSIQQERADEFGFPAMPDLSCASGNQKKKKKKKKKLLPQLAVSKLRSALTSLGRGGGSNHHSGHVSNVVGTLFGHRRGRVHFAVQSDTRAGPEFLIQLAAPTSVLVREMASGLVRIALECEKKVPKKAAGKLLEEPVWKVYCNGRKSGYGLRRECGPEEARVLRALEPVSMGAGLLPGDRPGSRGDGDGDVPARGELMYMRARFERVVGSRDLEAFYMMNPDGSGGPELSFYLLRV